MVVRYIRFGIFSAATALQVWAACRSIIGDSAMSLQVSENMYFDIGIHYDKIKQITERVYRQTLKHLRYMCISESVSPRFVVIVRPSAISGIQIIALFGPDSHFITHNIYTIQPWKPSLNTVTIWY